MNRREFVQQYFIARMIHRTTFDSLEAVRNDSGRKMIQEANFYYDAIEQDEKVSADNSMPDTRDYLNGVTGGH